MRPRDVSDLPMPLLLLLLVLAAGCQGVYEPGPGSLTGTWQVYFTNAPEDFIFELEEDAAGRVAGTWSHPPMFYRAQATGQRTGSSVILRMDSPNSHFAGLEVSFVNRERLEGSLLFGGSAGRVRLQRVN